MEKKLQFGMIGGGNGAFIGNVHRVGATLDTLAVLTAGCFTRDREKSLATAKEWNVPDLSRVYPDYQTMAIEEGKREDKIDFVIITTPNNTHYEISKTFLLNGINVVCDKPLTIHSYESEELKEIAEQKGLSFCVTYAYAAYAMIHQAREMIANGEIGDIVYMRGRFIQGWLADALSSESSEQAMWRLDPNISGPSGCNGDIGTHVESILSTMTGLKPKSVLARFSHMLADLPLENHSEVLVKFENDVPGMILSSQISIGHDCDPTVEIIGTKGAIIWSHLIPWELQVSLINKPKQIYTNARPYLHNEAGQLHRLPAGHMEGVYESFANIYRAYCYELLNKNYGGNFPKLTYPTIDMGVTGIKYIEACVKSNENGNVWVEL